MKKEQFLSLCIWIAALPGAPPVFAQADGGNYQMDLDFIENLYLAQRQEAAKPVEELNAKYRAALEKYRNDFQAAGNLDGVLEAQKAIDENTRGVAPDGKSTDATLQKFEEVYLKQHAEVEKAIEGPLLKADQDYAKLLDELAIRLTKAGKIDEAIKVRSVSENAKKKVAVVEAKRDLVRSNETSVKIIMARYGTGGTYGDVTARVKDLVEVKRETFWASPKLFGGDPSPGWNKSVHVKWSKDGVTRERWWGKDVPLRIEDFYGPQDKEELARWLVGTSWKADVVVNFKSGETFDLAARLGSYKWSVPEPRKVMMIWSTSEVITGTFNETWTEFVEQSGRKRTFRKVK